jgi:tetratricopeptide (TPR) repeat protein
MRDELAAVVDECGASSVDAAVAYNQLGVACKFAGRFDDAAAAYAAALPTAEAEQDHDPALLATLLHNLGGLAHSRGRYEEAEMLARRGLQLRETRCADDNSLAADTAALASILEHRDRWDEAEELYRRALRAWTDVGDRYEIAMTLNGLAAAIRFGGRPGEAEPLFRDALELQEAERGEAHPDTSTIRNNLAMLLNATDRAAEALPLLIRAAADLEAALGPDHPATIDVRNNRDKVAAGWRPE